MTKIQLGALAEMWRHFFDDAKYVTVVRLHRRYMTLRDGYFCRYRDDYLPFVGLLARLAKNRFRLMVWGEKEGMSQAFLLRFINFRV